MGVLYQELVSTVKWYLQAPDSIIIYISSFARFSYCRCGSLTQSHNYMAIATQCTCMIEVITLHGLLIKCMV